MKAAVIREYGGIDKVRIEEVPDPEPAAGEAIVDIEAAALNHVDIWIIRGSRGGPLTKPLIIGADGTGVVSAVGPGVSTVQVGQEVILNSGLSCGVCEWCQRGQQSECINFTIVGGARNGTYAQKVVLPELNMLPRPAHLSIHEAAGLTITFLTAWRMLMTRAAARPGESVLIHGIGGGVALAALQLAKLIALQTIVTSSSDEKLRRAKALGADHTINYRTTPDVAQAVRDLTGRRGVDIIIDSVGGATWPINLKAVRKGGRVAICGVTGGAEAPTDLRTLYWNQISLLGSTLGSRDEFRQMVRAVSQAKIKPVIDTVMPLEKVSDALRRLEKGEQFGKIVLEVGKNVPQLPA